MLGDLLAVELRIADVAVPLPGTDDVEAADRDPVALVVGAGQQVAWTHADAAGCAQAGADLLAVAAILADPHHRRVLRETHRSTVPTLGDVEITRAIGDQVHGEVVILGPHRD